MKKSKQVFALFIVFVFVLSVFSFQVKAEGGTKGLGETCAASSECAGAGSICHTTDEYCYIPLGEGPQNVGEILQIMGKVGDFIFAIFMGIALLFIVWGAMQFVMYGGEPAKVSEAKDRMKWAAIGIGIALAAAFVDDVLQSILGIS